MIQPERVQSLNDAPVAKGRYVLYWMQASQRTGCNHALEYAVRRANELELPLVVGFGLTDRFPEANLRHYVFMLEGLREVRRSLEARGIRFVLLRKSPEKAAVELANEASMVVADRGYLRIQQEWREVVAARVSCPVVQVESDVIVPVEVASPKEEYSAATLRRKLQAVLGRFLVPVEEGKLERRSSRMQLKGIEMSDPRKMASELSVDRDVEPVTSFRGGQDEAQRLLDEFISEKLRLYGQKRNEPSLDCVSHMSPYLHFGQISPLDVALRVKNARGAPRSAKDAFLEELIVRRELSMNFVYYNPRYDAYDSLPDWAAATLADHAGDPREYVYSLDELEAGGTHDPYWNAAQREMVATGKMHNYMRMYWGKKILEWSRSPEKAFRNTLLLNNKYELDGRDPNSFAGVAWCFGKHDRPWAERPVFGKVRYMNAAGLERKFDMEAYIKKVERLAGS